MKYILQNLDELKKIILKEKGQLYYMGIISRVDKENKWDVLLTAEWIKENNSEKDLVYILDKLKELFEGNLDFLSNVVLYEPEEDFVFLLKDFCLENEVKLNELNKFLIWEDGYVETYPIHCDFSEYAYKSNRENEKVTTFDNF